jgi:two-component system cell cycle sensor histidine kinase/response regulator CckA
MDRDAKLFKLRRLEAAAQALRVELGMSPEGSPQPGLSKREALLVEAERVAHLGSWTWNLQTSEIVWSDELYRILGLEIQAVEPSAERFFGAIHPDDRARVEAHTQRSLQAGIPIPVEHRIVRPSGEVRFVRMEPAFVREPDGPIGYVVGTMLDETDKLRQAALLANTVAELNEAHRLAGLGSWRFVLAEQRCEWSEGMYHLMGMAERPPPTPELFYAHVHPEDVAHVHAVSERALANRSTEQLELRVVRDDGSVRDAVLHARPFFDDAGRLGGFFGVLQDVSERRALEERVRHSQKMEAVGTLAGGVAHDFNNYLLILSGHVELLEALQAFEGPAKASLDAIKQASERCSVLTQQLLTLSRKRRSKPRRLDATELLRSVEPTLRSLLGATITLRVELEEAALPVLADPTQLDQIVMNLVINARDAMPDGGTLTVRLEDLPATQEREHWARLTVRDTGHGIPEALQSRVFEPFFTTKSPGKGTGLGLAIVYGRAQEAGGRVELESTPGLGSAFHVYLQPAAAGGVVDDDDVHVHAYRGNGERILVIEDVADVRELVSAQLRLAGYHVLTANDGEAALAVLETEQVNAVVSDVVMPKMGGPRFLAELRALHPQVPCLLMTAYSAEDVQEGRPDQPVLRKPFSWRELLSALASLLDGSASAGKQSTAHVR